MYIARVPDRPSRPAILRRESCREDGKVRPRTLANLTHGAPERIVAMERLVKGECDDRSGAITGGERFGVLFARKPLADQVGLTRVLGSAAEGELTLFPMLARIAHGGSRRSAVRWAPPHAVADGLGVAGFAADDRYAALDWLARQPAHLGRELYQARVKEQGQPPVLVRYDVTSSHVEGECNALGQYGDNRDGKRGKRRIGSGWLAAADGEPPAVPVFAGNTADPTPVAGQPTILQEPSGIAGGVMVGDRGMLKAKGKAALSAQGCRYTTAVTDAPARTFLKRGALQPDLFDAHLREVEHDDQRPIVRRNEAVRGREERRREDQLTRLQAKVAERNACVKNSARASAATGLAALRGWAKRHPLTAVVTLALGERVMVGTIDEEATAQDAPLGGRYLLETDVPVGLMDAQTVDARYRDLRKVAHNFRTVQTTFLEIRPICLRQAERTKARVFVAMLALKITRQFPAGLRQAFGTTDADVAAITPDDALVAPGRLTYRYTTDRNGQRQIHRPRPDEHHAKIRGARGLAFPLKPKIDQRAA